MADSQRIGLDGIVRHFQELEDPRSTVNRQHHLVSVVVIALMAILAGAGGPTAIAQWAMFKQELLLKSLPLPNGIPRKDVFRRVLMALKPGAFQACFASWLRSLRATAAVATGVEQPVLAVDGKTARRSHDHRNGLGALHAVSVWASELGLSLGGYGQELCLGIFQAAGFSLIPSTKTVPLTTSTRSGEPFNDRQPLDALSISLNTIVRHATRLPLPLVLS